MATARPGRPVDGPRLHDIQTAAIAEPWPEILDLAIEDGPMLRVLEADGELLGYGIAIVADDPLAYIPEFAVDPEKHGQGYGTTLLRELAAALHEEGVERVRLTARDGDRHARQFYARRGFAVIDRIPDHFENEAGVLYERRIGMGST